MDNQVYGGLYHTSLYPEPNFVLSERPYWRCYFPNTSAIIYVIDSSDQARLATSRTELLTMLSEEELKGAPLLVFCNKQDVDGALKPEEISEKLGLAGGEKTRPWSVRGSCATKGEGLDDGLDWYDCLPFEYRSQLIPMPGSLMQYSTHDYQNHRLFSAHALHRAYELAQPFMLDTLICTLIIFFGLSR